MMSLATRCMLGVAALWASLTVVPLVAQAQDYPSIVAAPDRSDADRKTDQRRNPAQLLAFVGPKAGWRVLDMGADAGYSTELLARSVGPTGRVYAQNDDVPAAFETRLSKPVMQNVVSLHRPADDPLPADVHDLDLITFFFAYHDTTYMPIDRAKMDRALFAALKPGGIMVVADHSAKPEDGATVGKKFHRIAQQTLRAEVEAAGFVFVEEGNFLRHPEDARDAIVFHNPTPIDEFVLKFRRP